MEVEREKKPRKHAQRGQKRQRQTVEQERRANRTAGLLKKELPGHAASAQRKNGVQRRQTQCNQPHAGKQAGRHGNTKDGKIYRGQKKDQLGTKDPERGSEKARKTRGKAKRMLNNEAKGRRRQTEQKNGSAQKGCEKIEGTSTKRISERTVSPNAKRKKRDRMAIKRNRGRQKKRKGGEERGEGR